MNRRLAGGLVVLIVVLLSGCALSPQSVPIRPVISAPSSLASGQPLIIEVIDNRARDDFGARGGIYQTAVIRPLNNVATAVQQALAVQLAQAGFQPVDAGRSGSGDAPRLQIGIQTIDYRLIATGVAQTVEVTVALQASAEQRGRQTHGIYRATNSQQSVNFLTAEQNERLLNQTLSQALQQLLQDRTLLSVLTG